LKHILLCWIFLFILTLSLTGCQEQSQQDFNPPWKAVDVRSLDAIDSTSPQKELIALYTRDLEKSRQVRIDFLELPEVIDFDIYLFLDHQPAGGVAAFREINEGIAWDTMVEIRSSGHISSKIYMNDVLAWTDYSGISIRVLRNPVLDTIEVSLAGRRLDHFSPKTRVKVAVTDPDSGEILDETDAVVWDQLPMRQVPILLAFTNTFPAYTPSQGLRRWDGAHTGPMGGRHGLSNLLRVSRNHQVHLLLLDLLKRQSLAALDYHRGVDQLKLSYQDQLLSLAIPLLATTSETPPWLVEQTIASSQAMAQQAGIPAPFITYEPASLPEFDSLGSLAHFSTWEKPVSLSTSLVRPGTHGIHIRLPAFKTNGEPDQATPDGLSLPWKEFLAQIAWKINLPDQSIDSASLVVMGGSLPQSTWGHPASARAAMKYIHDHPWLKFVGKYEIQAGERLIFPNWSPDSLSQTASAHPDETQLSWLFESLRSYTDHSLGQAALDVYSSLSAPVFPMPADLPSLRQKYQGEAGKIIEAARWADKPISSLNCTADPDQDGLQECILTTETVFAVFELESGFLSDLFVSCEKSIHQVIGSSAQLITGLSDPIDWDLTDPVQADPGVYPGAFAGPPGHYSWRMENDDFVMSTPDNLVEKRFHFFPGGLQVELSTQSIQKKPDSLNLPLIIDPWERFSTQGLDAYKVMQQPAGETGELTWGIEGGFQVTVSSPGRFDWVTFKDSQSDLFRPENPNFEYPEGHFLPYPLAVIKMAMQESLVVDLRFHCPP
jgi:hypothetical protein